MCCTLPLSDWEQVNCCYCDDHVGCCWLARPSPPLSGSFIFVFIPCNLSHLPPTAATQSASQPAGRTVCLRGSHLTLDLTSHLPEYQQSKVRSPVTEDEGKVRALSFCYYHHQHCRRWSGINQPKDITDQNIHEDQHYFWLWDGPRPDIATVRLRQRGQLLPDGLCWRPVL